MLKVLLLALLIGVIVWLLRGARSAGKPPVQSPEPPDKAAVMVVCAHCGVHLPAAEALSGPGGVFCCEAHRAAGPVSR